MSTPEFAARVAVGQADGPYSATFRIWVPPGKSDVYASVRERAGDFKVSLHESGICYAGLTHPFALKESDAIVAIGGSRHQSTWTRRMHTGARVVAPLQFAIPASELRTWRRHGPDRDDVVTWLPTPPVGHSAIISCLFSGPALSDDQWPGRRSGTHLLRSLLLPNGEKFWLLWQDWPTTSLEHSILADARERIKQGGMVQFSHITDESPSPPRVLIFKEVPEDNGLIVMDAALDSLDCLVSRTRSRDNGAANWSAHLNGTTIGNDVCPRSG